MMSILSSYGRCVNNDYLCGYYCYVVCFYLFGGQTMITMFLSVSTQIIICDESLSYPLVASRSPTSDWCLPAAFFLWRGILVFFVFLYILSMSCPLCVLSIVVNASSAVFVQMVRATLQLDVL